MLLSRNAIDDAAELLKPEDFYKPAHAIVYETILALQMRGDPSDPVTVKHELSARGQLDAAGGSGALVSLQAGTPATSNAVKYAQIVRGHSALRRLIGAAGEIAEIGYTSLDDPAGAIDTAETLLQQIGDRQRASTSALVSAAEAVSGWLDGLDTRAERGGLPTGFGDLDSILGGGLHPGQLITVCARTSMGKSAFAGCIATNVADRGRPTLVVSLEMELEELLDRYVSAMSQIGLGQIRSGNIGNRDWARVSQGAGVIASLPLWLDDSPGTTLHTIRASVRRAARVARIELVIVDYLQLVHATTHAENRQVEVAEISAGLKMLARDLQVPVVALAQLNRSIEFRSDKRPMLADLRESGAIENDSDVVLGLYRDDYYKPKSPDAGVLEVIILKQRNGPKGTVRLGFLPQISTVSNLPKPEQF